MKQGCESKQFIAINDKLKVRFFYIKQLKREREQDSGETERERVRDRP